MKDSVLLHILQQYEALSPKARRILEVITLAGEPLTRNEIAARLYQPRLYDHDLKLLQKLADEHFIGVDRRRRHHVEVDRNPEYKFIVDNYERVYGGDRKRLRWGKMDFMYEYWVNGSREGILRKMMKAARKVEQAEREQIARNQPQPYIQVHYPFPAVWYRFLEWLGLYP